MSVEQGFGMLAVGLIVMAIAGSIIFFVINKMQRDEIAKEEKKKMERILG
jgi:hypothetical protein